MNVMQCAIGISNYQRESHNGHVNMFLIEQFVLCALMCLFAMDRDNMHCVCE
jgi:hypothetical protein